MLKAQIPTLHMLISIENTLGQLLDQMEVLPLEVVAQYEKKFGVISKILIGKYPSEVKTKICKFCEKIGGIVRLL